MEPTTIKNPLEIDPKIDVENRRPKIDKNRPLLGAPQADKRSKEYSPGRGAGGGEIPPRVGKEALRTDGGYKPPQPIWLVGLPRGRQSLPGARA